MKTNVSDASPAGSIISKVFESCRFNCSDVTSLRGSGKYGHWWDEGLPYQLAKYFGGLFQLCVMTFVFSSHILVFSCLHSTLQNSAYNATVKMIRCKVQTTIKKGHQPYLQLQLQIKRLAFIFHLFF